MAALPAVDLVQELDVVLQAAGILLFGVDGIPRGAGTSFLVRHLCCLGLKGLLAECQQGA